VRQPQSMKTFSFEKGVTMSIQEIQPCRSTILLRGTEFLNRVERAALAITVLIYASSAIAKEETQKSQYSFEEISVVAASADEPLLDRVSVKKAIDYLETGATAWTKKRKCISCHTNGSYMVLRPALTKSVGKPSEEIHEFYVAKLAQHQGKKLEELHKGVTPTELAYLAGGLAEWDAHVTGELSVETKQALTLMFQVQAEDGSYANQSCWPPYESSDYHGATIAAMAAATAPGYLDSIEGEPQVAYEQLIRFLQDTEPAHDYARLQLLWVATRIDGLLTEDEKQTIITMIFEHQQEDGGWSIRTFAAPDAWGSGNREEKLRQELDFESPASDGHQTGLAIVVLREAGVAANDPRILKGVVWIGKNQRESGRWWTRSLNNDKFHFITYSGTCFPLLALAKTDRLPPVDVE
jgi:squalene-hopene/tetraprenyl-beta-curcumene cyclase